jgi:hypothetical protein
VRLAKHTPAVCALKRRFCDNGTKLSPSAASCYKPPAARATVLRNGLRKFSALPSSGGCQRDELRAAVRIFTLHQRFICKKRRRSPDCRRESEWTA